MFDAPKLENVRFLMVRELPNDIVWYRVTGVQVEILRVLHAAQDAESELAN